MTPTPHPRQLLSAATLAALLLAGCSASPPAASNNATEVRQPEPAEAPAEPLPTPSVPVADNATADAPTVGGDGSQIVLTPLSHADIESAALAGELACSFSATGSDSPLLLARGDVASTERAQGVVKVLDSVEPVSAPGGFDAMSKGTRFAGKGKTITLRVTGPATDRGESPARPATLTYDRADGAQRSFSGLWVCGP